VANAVFYEKQFKMLSEGGMIVGDIGILRKAHGLFFASEETYRALKGMVPDDWLGKRVVLFAGMDIASMNENVFLVLSKFAKKPIDGNVSVLQAKYTPAK
jgi:hypothetical protein